MAHWLNKDGVAISCPSVQVTSTTDLSVLPRTTGNEWLLTSKLVVKPDQLIKRRGKSGLIGLNLTFDQVKEWITERMNKSFTIGKTTGTLDTFIIEPFVPHDQSDEYYIAIHSTREHDVILFHHEGGVDIGDVDSKAITYDGPLEGQSLDLLDLEIKLLKNLPENRKPVVLRFISSLYSLYQRLHFCYLEINPLVYDTKSDSLVILDLAAKVDEAATFLVQKQWSLPVSSSYLEFPPQFGQGLSEDEQIIHDLDAKTGASLKLTLLNPKGSIWTLVAGGGSSVVIADTIASYGFTEELANYGEYSGAPNTEHTYLYAKTVLDVMCRPSNNSPENRKDYGKVLIIAGAIANFTDIAATFKGIIQALWEYKNQLINLGTKIYIRRAGPNSTLGLQLMRDECKKMGIEAHVFGAEIAMTGIVPFALGLQPTPYSIRYTPKYVIPQPKLNDSLDVIGGNAPRYDFGEELGEIEHVKKHGLKNEKKTSSPNEKNISTQQQFLGIASSESDPSITRVSATTISPIAQEELGSTSQPTIESTTESTASTSTSSSTSTSTSTSLQNNSNTTKPTFVNGFYIDQSTHPNIKLISQDEHTKTQQSIYESLSNSPSTSSTPQEIHLFTPTTQVIVYGLQTTAVQHMLDFDYINNRQDPSVKALVYPFQGNHLQKFFWHKQEILIPCFSSFSEAMEKFPKVDCVINFASFRSAYETTMEMLEYTPKLSQGTTNTSTQSTINTTSTSSTSSTPQSPLKSITIIAEGVPERQARLLAQKAKEKKITIIGPATVGGISPTCVRLGNSGGALVNIVQSKLFQRGSVAYVTRSGGLSNELNNILAQNTDGVCEGIAIGGDRYPSSTFVDHLLRFENDSRVKMMVLIGEVGGIEEYRVMELLKDKKLTKPLIATCIGTIADQFTYDVQFGHAGASSGVAIESAVVKNEQLKKSGAIVPESFDHLGQVLNEVYSKLIENGTIPIVKYEQVTKDMPYLLPKMKIPIDFKWAMKQGMIRKPTSFLSTISDERGDELKYNGVLISTIIQRVIQHQSGIGNTIGHLWFKKELPGYFAQFIELVIALTADHGPAVSGAIVTNITARAGKDLTSSLTAGLLTIGERWGGALNEASKQFYQAVVELKLSPQEFITKCQKDQVLISGIGHKIKSLENPDQRVVLLKQFIQDHVVGKVVPNQASSSINQFNQSFESLFPVLSFALEVEKLTTKKRSNLILNVDGFIACTMVDLWLAHPHLFGKDDIERYLDIGMMNGFFILGRSIGLIGHYIDQNRLQQPLYRHSDDDIFVRMGDFE